MAFADLPDSRTAGRYEGSGGDGQAPAVVFRYGAGGAGEQSDPVASAADDPRIGWDDPDGVQAVAQAILTHFTGAEPDQAALEALVMAKGDEWTAHGRWSLPAEELRAMI